MTPTIQGNLYTGGDAEASAAGRTHVSTEGGVCPEHGDDRALRTYSRSFAASTRQIRIILKPNALSACGLRKPEKVTKSSSGVQRRGAGSFRRRHPVRRPSSGIAVLRHDQFPHLPDHLDDPSFLFGDGGEDVLRLSVLGLLGFDGARRPPGEQVGEVVTVLRAELARLAQGRAVALGTVSPAGMRRTT